LRRLKYKSMAPSGCQRDRITKRHEGTVAILEALDIRLGDARHGRKHAVRSRAFGVDGNVQPAPDDPFLASRRAYSESVGQVTRRVRIR
jgi:hypothetical protein